MASTIVRRPWLVSVNERVQQVGMRKDKAGRGDASKVLVAVDVDELTCP